MTLVKRMPGFASVVKRLTDRAYVEECAIAALKDILAAHGALSELADVNSTLRAITKGRPGAALEFNDSASTQTLIVTGNNATFNQAFWSESVSWMAIVAQAFRAAHRAAGNQRETSDDE